MKTSISFGNVLMSALLGCALALGAVGGFSSGFSVAVASVWLWIAAAIGAAVLGTACGRGRYSWILLAAASVVGTVLLVVFGSFVSHGMAIIDRVTLAYQEAYGWEPTSFFADPLFLKTPGQPIVWLTAVLGAWLSFAFAKGAQPLIVIGVSALPILPCLVATHTPPGGVWMFLWVVGLVTYLLAVSGAKQRRAPRVTRTLTAAVAVVAATAVLFCVFPSDGDYDLKHEWRDHLLHRIGLHSGSEDNIHSAYSRSPVEELEEAGYPRSSQMVMKLLASKETVVYVREQDYNLYDGARWSSDPERYDSLRNGNDADWYLSVQTPINYARKFVPYYPASRATAEGGNIRNMKRDTEYTWKVAELDENWKEQVEAMAANTPAYTPPSVTYELPEDYLPSLDGDLFVPYERNDFAMMPPSIYGHEHSHEITVAPQWEMWIEGYYDEYLALPEATAAWAQTVVAPLVEDGMTYTKKADAVADYVKAQADYVEYTYSAPEEGEDFARWFLEDYQKGCCVHFATATAVLLRAAGVPTRYVTGYAREVERTTWTAVLEKHAHAWVEYYEPLMDRWVRLEATPAAALGLPTEETEPTDEADTTTTTAPSDTETTETTKPSVSEPDRPLVTLPIKEILLTAAGIAAVVIAVAGQRAIRLRVRRRRRARSDPNTRARLLWHDAGRLAAACREDPPERLYELAQKAAFSRDTLTTDELACFEAYNAEAVTRLRRASWIRRIWFRLVLVLY